MVLRKHLDTKRRRNTNNSYHQTPQPLTSRTRRDGKNYRTHQPTILLAKHKRRHQTIHQRLRHMSEDQGGPTYTLRIATVKRGPRLTVEINSYGLHYGPAKIIRISHHTGGHRSADQNEAFNFLLEGPRHTALRHCLHERDS